MQNVPNYVYVLPSVWRAQPPIFDNKSNKLVCVQSISPWLSANILSPKL